MVESLALQLTTQAQAFNEATVSYVTQQLIDAGYEGVTPTLLSFLSILECGVNHASSIARDLGVSRQMVAKTVKELSSLGYLIQQDGFGKQKDILFTVKGEQLMSDARKILHAIDTDLINALNQKQLTELITQLGLITELVNQKL